MVQAEQLKPSLALSLKRNLRRKPEINKGKDNIASMIHKAKSLNK